MRSFFKKKPSGIFAQSRFYCTGMCSVARYLRVTVSYSIGIDVAVAVAGLARSPRSISTGWVPKVSIGTQFAAAACEHDATIYFRFQKSIGDAKFSKSR